MIYNTFYHPCSLRHKWLHNKATATPSTLILLPDTQKNKRRAWQHGKIFKKIAQRANARMKGLPTSLF